ncbi:MAG: response regulator [Ardenticatenaceae bacterium]|nr:response regulator [Ardenticatenaceae bacterium]MCB8990155.1 response regulator [Ardenticatenaceae bacterium]
MTHSVLVVDDEKMTRDLLRMMLQPAGFEISEAENGLEALQQIAKQRPDIVILDVMMPEMDGLTACAEIRRNPQTANLPVIMLSAKTHGTAVAEGLAAGADLYLTKPIARQKLIEAIHALINNKEPA